MLKSQGMQANQQVMVLSDGGETVREFQMYLHPEAEHLLDWFHMAMRVTVMRQIAKGIAMDELDIVKPLERMKWYLWHGNVLRALQVFDNLVIDLEDIERTTENVKRLRKVVGEFRAYIAANRPFIPNYGIGTAMARRSPRRLPSPR